MPSTCARSLAGASLLLAVTAAAVSAQQIRGRVVDEQSRQAVVDATVTLLGADSAMITRGASDANGFFILRVAAEGRYTIVVERLGYAVERRAVAVATGDLTVPAFVLRAQAIELDSVAANVRRTERDPAVVGFTRSAHIAAGERLARLERQGARMLAAVRELSGAHVREWNDRTGRTHVCIEHRRRIRAIESASDCEWVVIVLDGITLGRDQLTFRNLGSLQSYESVELLSGVEASKYGMDASANGALVLWTRGRGPHVDPARNKQ